MNIFEQNLPMNFLGFSPLVSFLTLKLRSISASELESPDLAFPTLHPPQTDFNGIGISVFSVILEGKYEIRESKAIFMIYLPEPFHEGC